MEPTLKQGFDCRGVHWDVIVIGAGPAGSIAAAQCATRGLTVLLLEKQKFPRTKVCGCCVSREALVALDQLGAAKAMHRIHKAPLSAWQVAHAGRSVRFSDRDFGAGIARCDFDSALASFAVDRGACFRDGSPAEVGEVKSGHRNVRLRTGSDWVTLRARTVIAAFGLGVRLHGDTGPAVLVAPGSRLGASAIAAEGPAAYRSGTIYMACGRNGYVGLVRLADGRLNLAAALDSTCFRQQGAGSAAAEVLARAGWPDPGCEALAWRGTARLTSRAKVPAGERLFLVGDAAGYVEPFTGDGMTRAIQGGAAVAEYAAAACREWDDALIPAWSARHHALTSARTRRTRLAAAILRSPAATQAALAALYAFPPAARWIVDLCAAPAVGAGAASE